MKKKNILFLIPELGGGGAERSLILLANKLSVSYNVNICVFIENPTPYKTEVPITVLCTPHRKNLAGKAISWVKRWQRLKKLKNRLKTEITISFLEGANYLNCLTRKNDKIIVSVRGSKVSDGEISGFSGFIRKKLLIPFLFRKSDKVVAVSTALAHELNKIFRVPKNKLLVIHNFYDFGEIDKKSNNILTNNERHLFTHNVLINSGRFHKQKEHEGLLKVFKEVVKEYPCKLVLLGDGHLKEYILNLTVNQLGLTIQELYDDIPVNNAADVYFLGYKKNPFKYVSRANIYINSSSWEGFPNALTEAMICRTPVISTDCPTGPREILEFDSDGSLNSTTTVLRNKNGSLMHLLNNYEKRTTNDWKNEIIYYLKNREYASGIGENARHTAEKYQSSQVMIKWFELIDNY
jgi:glycosyltransferase involved in cell wall biosynthesis